MAATMVLTWVALPVPKIRQHAEQRVEHGQELPVLAQTVFDVVHRAADPLAGGAALPEKCTASVTSANLVHIPNSAEHHIQNTAPGPPMAIAPATPAMLPVPTVPASAVQTAWNGVICTVRGILFAEHTPDGGFDRIREICGSAKKPVRTLSSSPTPMMHTIAGMPHTKLLTA